MCLWLDKVFETDYLYFYTPDEGPKIWEEEQD